MSISHTVKTLVTGAPVLLTGGTPHCRAGDDRLVFHQPDLQAEVTIKVSSPAFTGGESMPTEYSVDGQSISPPLQLDHVPADARSLVLIVEDPDAPLPNPFVHWLLWNLPADTREVPAGLQPSSLPGSLGDARQGKNSALKNGWAGMAPPKGDVPHRYFFQVLALSKVLDLADGSGRHALVDSLKGAVLSRGLLIGTYQR